ncbi:MAG: cyclic nucleotide-binding domain-containing protein [Anaerolineales bacterium]|jgi:CRP/FNR family cyclic AMP-dependent transcriptional regulator
MVSPELIRRYPYFSGLTIEQINLLANIAEEIECEPGCYFHHEGDNIDKIYVIMQGDVSLITSLPQQDKEVVINTFGTGDVFGWTSLLPPYTAGAGAKAVNKCKLLEFESKKLREKFEADYQFGYQMMTKVAQIARERLDAIVMETLAYQAEK